MSSIDYFPMADDATVARGSERAAWWIMSGRASGTVGYVNARDLVGAANVLPGSTVGAAATPSFQATVSEGAYRRIRGVTNAAPSYVTLANDTALVWLPSRMDAVSAYAPPFGEVMIYRELIRTESSAPLPVNHQLTHGFSLQGNLLTGFPQLGAGSWRGIALVERETDVVLAVKNANPATIITLPSLSLVNLQGARYKVEHRLYAPTASDIGRYELWVNDVLQARVLGNHPNFPHPASITDGWKPMPYALNNPGGAVTVDLKAWWGEIIIGPDSDGTY